MGSGNLGYVIGNNNGTVTSCYFLEVVLGGGGGIGADSGTSISANFIAAGAFSAQGNFPGFTFGSAPWKMKDSSTLSGSVKYRPVLDGVGPEGS